MGSLNGEQFEQLLTALVAAYDYQSMQRMLKFRLDQRIDLIVSQGTPFDYQVFQIIEHAERQGWTLNLLIAARSYNPGNPELLTVANIFGLAATVTPTSNSALESIIRRSNSYLDPVNFRTRQGWIETSVCRIKINGLAVGTGFLVGPKLIMTNHHVVAQFIDSKASPPITCQFDFKRSMSGQELSQGVECAVSEVGWLVAATPPTLEETANRAKTALPRDDELDFALLRLSQSLGTLELGMQAPLTKGITATIPRAWLPLNLHHDFASGSPLFIMQHPKSGPLQMALDTNAVIGLNANETRVTYRTNTENGSSGSPVFDQNWNLVALHHMGDPAWQYPTQNEGIPVKSIVAYLEGQGLADVLGKQDT